MKSYFTQAIVGLALSSTTLAVTIKQEASDVVDTIDDVSTTVDTVNTAVEIGECVADLAAGELPKAYTKYQGCAVKSQMRQSALKDCPEGFSRFTTVSGILMPKCYENPREGYICDILGGEDCVSTQAVVCPSILKGWVDKGDRCQKPNRYRRPYYYFFGKRWHKCASGWEGKGKYCEPTSSNMRCPSGTKDDGTDSNGNKHCIKNSYKRKIVDASCPAGFQYEVPEPNAEGIIVSVLDPFRQVCWKTCPAGTEDTPFLGKECFTDCKDDQIMCTLTPSNGSFLDEYRRPYFCMDQQTDENGEPLPDQTCEKWSEDALKDGVELALLGTSQNWPAFAAKATCDTTRVIFDECDD